MKRNASIISILRERASLLSEIRHFFADRGVLEVDTPVLSSAANPDAAIAPLLSGYFQPGAYQSQRLYLQTSPEFAMKRLLAAGSGSIFQVCHAFRNGELGGMHNPEFTLLEWYRIDYDHLQLMDEVDVLLMQLLPGCKAAQRHRYADLFLSHTGLDLFAADERLLQQRAVDAGVVMPESASTEWLIEMLFEQCVGPWLRQQQGVMVTDYPAAQASLSRLSAEDPRVAERFEYYYRGMELANGFHELADAGEQRMRFEAENRKRRQAGQEQLPLDEQLLQALEHGLPECSGVALGVDRLLMLRCGADSIQQVLAFPFDHFSATR
ncbi:MAG: EF-P lysine aminoacylase EpmA [Pseudomonadota bacterium]